MTTNVPPIFRAGDRVILTGQHLGVMQGKWGTVLNTNSRVDAYGRASGWACVELDTAVKVSDTVFKTGVFGVSALSLA
jgi:hypothetical protein